MARLWDQGLRSEPVPRTCTLHVTFNQRERLLCPDPRFEVAGANWCTDHQRASLLKEVLSDRKRNFG